jgi:hypothetical protein
MHSDTLEFYTDRCPTVAREGAKRVCGPVLPTSHHKQVGLHHQNLKSFSRTLVLHDGNTQGNHVQVLCDPKDSIAGIVFFHRIGVSEKERV